MITRFHLATLFTFSIAVGFAPAPVRGQLFNNKAKELPSFQANEGKKLPKLNLFPSKKTEAVPAPDPISVTTSIPDTPAAPAATLEATTIEAPKKERRLKLPIPKFKRDKPSATIGETEILTNQGGTLVKPGETAQEVATFTANKNSSTPQLPRNVNGTVIYNDWDDVKAYKTSAAQEIVHEMKAREAEHKQKQAVAERQMEAKLREAEAQMKKAQAEHRKRALLQGGGLPGGVPGAAGLPGGAPSGF